MVLGQVPLCAPGYLAANCRHKWQPINYSLGLFIDHHLWQIGSKCSYPERSKKEKALCYWFERRFRLINYLSTVLIVVYVFQSTTLPLLDSWIWWCHGPRVSKKNIEAGSSLEFPRLLHSFQSRLVSIACHKLSTFTLFCFRGYISTYHPIREVTTAQFLEYFESNAWRLLSTQIGRASCRERV